MTHERLAVGTPRVSPSFRGKGRGDASAYVVRHRECGVVVPARLKYVVATDAPVGLSECHSRREYQAHRPKPAGGGSHDWHHGQSLRVKGGGREMGPSADSGLRRPLVAGLSAAAVVCAAGAHRAVSGRQAATAATLGDGGPCPEELRRRPFALDPREKRGERPEWDGGRRLRGHGPGGGEAHPPGQFQAFPGEDGSFRRPTGRRSPRRRCRRGQQLAELTQLAIPSDERPSSRKWVRPRLTFPKLQSGAYAGRAPCARPAPAGQQTTPSSTRHT